MAKLTVEDIKKISRLARIEIAEQERETMVNQVGGIIQWVEKLNEVNTDKVEPLTNVCNMNLRLEKDVITDGNIADEVLKNAPNAVYGYFSVPKVIE